MLRRFTHAQSVWLILKLEEEGRVGESSSVHRFHCRSLYIPSSSFGQQGGGDSSVVRAPDS